LQEEIPCIEIRLLDLLHTLLTVSTLPSFHMRLQSCVLVSVPPSQYPKYRLSLARLHL
jgi:hypothetical protein